eukprot:10891930-Alexandrium_andersonii.AAC.1
MAGAPQIPDKEPAKALAALAAPAPPTPRLAPSHAGGANRWCPVGGGSLPVRLLAPEAPVRGGAGGA